MAGLVVAEFEIIVDRIFLGQDAAALVVGQLEPRAIGVDVLVSLAPS
jgi:hypothetical protein